ncbi:hypothetical protein GA0061098_103455 [Bradyrhizobium shewense]|uniref:Uncharacterized protein n=1 Tax=Bradyrhizobium shewense TaxID=1761772 RepID=A0A1C3XS30_9BRAD|nr:hypothetical protein GA0061098_103455 [Bradyrhizobium shewense]
MTAIRLVVRYLFPSEKQILRLYRWFVPGEQPRCLEPCLWGAAIALLLLLYALIVLSAGD